jgi:hypothetical protein
MLVQFSEEELFGKPLSAEQVARIRALEDAGDEGIDTSDIPEVRELPAGAVRGRDFRPSPHQVPVYLEGELQSRLSEIALRKGITLSALVSQLLRKEIEIAEVLA